MRRVVAIGWLLVSVACGSGETPAPPASPPVRVPPPAGAPAMPAPSAPTAPTSESVAAGRAADREFCVAETNRYRAMVGVAAVGESADVEAYAARAARADHATERAHSFTSGPDGPRAGFAENEAVRWPLTTTERAVIERALAAFWSEGPGGSHYENMRGAWQLVGCGVYADGDAVTFVQHFR